MTGSLPFLKKRLESSDTSQMIRKITNKARAHLHYSTETTQLIPNQVQSIADQAKQSDTKGIKREIISLIPKKYFPPNADGSTAVNIHHHIGVTNPGIHKSWRGWENVVTARLLCPIDSIAEFESDSDEYAAVLMTIVLLLRRNSRRWVKLYKATSKTHAPGNPWAQDRVLLVHGP